MLQFDVRPPDRQRFLAALRRESAAQVPYWESEFAPGIVSAVLGHPVDVASPFLPPADYVRFLECVGVDMAYLFVFYKFGRKEYIDERGRAHYIDGLIKGRADLGLFRPPDLTPVRRRIEGFLQAAAGRGLGWIYSLPTTDGVVTAIGLRDYYLAMYDDPGFIDEFMDRYEAFTLPLTELVLAYRPDAVLLPTSLCGKTGPSIRTEHAEHFVFSRLARQMALVRGSGVPAILHSDGDNAALMERWIELGFAGLHPIEPAAGFDIYEIKRRWGDRIALLGNVDLAGVLTQGTPAEVAEDTRRHILGLSAGGGYICGSSHDIGENVPIANLQAMSETIAHTWR